MMGAPSLSAASTADQNASTTERWSGARQCFSRMMLPARPSTMSDSSSMCVRDANLRGAGRVAHRRRDDRFGWRRLEAAGGAAAMALRSPALWRLTNALYCYCARAYLVSASYASRILKEQSVWKRPVPFSEPGAALFLTICSVSSP